MQMNDYHTCSWGLRPGGAWTSPGGGGSRYRKISGQDFAREIQKFKNLFGLRPNDKGGPLLCNGRFAAEGRFIQYFSLRSSARGVGGICSHGGLTLASSGTCS